MLNSRNIADLDPRARAIAEKQIFACAAAGIEILITSTWRDAEKQNALYAIGRTPGDNRKCVTHAKGGQSWHQFRCAWDIVPVVAGKCVWDDPVLWEAVISIGESVGAEAGARGKTFSDRPHFHARPSSLTFEAAQERFNSYGTIFI